MDCMEGMREFPDGYFDLAVVDPPYGDAGQDFKRQDKSRFGGKFDRYKRENLTGGGTAKIDRRGGGHMAKHGTKIIGWDTDAELHAQKLVEREAERLRASFEAARADGYTRFLMFLHYPPTSVLERNSVFTAMAEEYGAEQVIYAHCHGESRFHDSLEGRHHGIRYSLASGDYLRWVPMKVL